MLKALMIKQHLQINPNKIVIILQIMNNCVSNHFLGESFDLQMKVFEFKENLNTTLQSQEGKLELLQQDCSS